MDVARRIFSRALQPVVLGRAESPHLVFIVVLQARRGKGALEVLFHLAASVPLRRRRSFSRFGPGRSRPLDLELRLRGGERLGRIQVLLPPSQADPARVGNENAHGYERQYSQERQGGK